MSDEQYFLTADSRAITGKHVKKLRREGLVPAIIYGQQEPVNIQLERKELRRVLRRASTSNLIEIDLEGDKRTVLAREIQQHVTRGDIMHVDFMEVDMKATLTSEAELVPVGISPAAEDGVGSVMLPLRSVEIECRPGDLVSTIEFDITSIVGPDSVIFVRDLTPPPGVDILTDGDMVIARLELMQEEEEEEVDELAEVFDAEAVEVIGREDDEEEAL